MDHVRMYKNKNRRTAHELKKSLTDLSQEDYTKHTMVSQFGDPSSLDKKGQKRWANMQTAEAQKIRERFSEAIGNNIFVKGRGASYRHDQGLEDHFNLMEAIRQQRPDMRDIGQAADRPGYTYNHMNSRDPTIGMDPALADVIRRAWDDASTLDPTVRRRQKTLQIQNTDSRLTGAGQQAGITGTELSIGGMDEGIIKSKVGMRTSDYQNRLNARYPDDHFTQSMVERLQVSRVNSNANTEIFTGKVGYGPQDSTSIDSLEGGIADIPEHFHEPSYESSSSGHGYSSGRERPLRLAGGARGSSTSEGEINSEEEERKYGPRERRPSPPPRGTGRRRGGREKGTVHTFKKPVAERNYHQLNRYPLHFIEERFNLKPPRGTRAREARASALETIYADAYPDEDLTGSTSSGTEYNRKVSTYNRIMGRPEEEGFRERVPVAGVDDEPVARTSASEGEGYGSGLDPPPEGDSEEQVFDRNRERVERIIAEERKERQMDVTGFHQNDQNKQGKAIQSEREPPQPLKEPNSSTVNDPAGQLQLTESEEEPVPGREPFTGPQSWAVDKYGGRESESEAEAEEDWPGYFPPAAEEKEREEKEPPPAAPKRKSPEIEIPPKTPPKKRSKSQPAEPSRSRSPSVASGYEAGPSRSPSRSRSRSAATEAWGEESGPLAGGEYNFMTRGLAHALGERFKEPGARNIRGGGHISSAGELKKAYINMAGAADPFFTQNYDEVFKHLTSAQLDSILEDALNSENRGESTREAEPEWDVNSENPNNLMKSIRQGRLDPDIKIAKSLLGQMRKARDEKTRDHLVRRYHSITDQIERAFRDYVNAVRQSNFIRKHGMRKNPKGTK